MAAGGHDDPISSPYLRYAGALGSGAYIYAEIASGRLRARKFGRLTRILRADFVDWLAAAPPISPASSSRTRTPGTN